MEKQAHFQAVMAFYNFDVELDRKAMQHQIVRRGVLTSSLVRLNFAFGG